MIIKIIPIIIALFVSMICSFASDKSIAEYLQDISVTVKSGMSEGSGVVLTRKDSTGASINIIWTAAHVVNDLRTSREIIAPDGSKKTLVEFKDAKIVKPIIESGRTVGRLEMDAEVLKFSDADSGEDLAILRLRKRDFISVSVKFYEKDDLVPLATSLLHCGSLLGQQGGNSITFGIYSQHGRVLSNGVVFDQVSVNSFPGSSGGGVYIKDTGEYCGCVLRGSGESFTLIAPIRRIRAWVKRINMEWALDIGQPMPSDTEIKKVPVEDVGGRFSGQLTPSDKKEFPFKIRELSFIR